MTIRAHMIGGSGFIGTRIQQLALGTDLRITSSGTEDRPSPDHETSYYKSLLAENDWIIYLANMSTPSSTNSQPLAEVEGNLIPLARFLQVAQTASKPRILYFSSAGTTYADDLSGDPTESSRLAPKSYHGAAKVAAECFLSTFARQTVSQVTVLRPSNVYGPGQVPRPGFGLIATAMDRCRRGEKLQIYGDGQSARDYLYVDDLCGLVTSILSMPFEQEFSVYNASSGKGYCNLDVVKVVEKVSGKKMMLEFRQPRSVDAIRVVPNPSKAAEKFGWTATTDLETGVRLTWQWFINQPR